ncbi:hypothetical protein D3C84_772830 [compost metagenome]
MAQPSEATNEPATLTMLLTSASHKSAATGKAAWAVAKAAVSLHSTVVFKAATAVVHVGAVVSSTVITCVNTAEVLPQSSLTVQVLV